MSGLIFVGGFHELEEICVLQGINVIGAIDSARPARSTVQYLGTDDDASNIFKKYPACALHITPDNPKIRRKLWNIYIDKYKKNAHTLIHPSCVVSQSSKIGDGCAFHMGVIISSANKIGVGVKINTGGCITHDVTVEDFVTIAPRAVVCSGVVVGSGAYIGANSTILPNIRIGKGSVVGAGSVVTKDVEDNAVVFGNPAKRKVAR